MPPSLEKAAETAAAVFSGAFAASSVRSAETVQRGKCKPSCGRIGDAPLPVCDGRAASPMPPPACAFVRISGRAVAVTPAFVRRTVTSSAQPPATSLGRNDGAGNIRFTAFDIEQ